tara:strand:+ start:667 stop:1440 length:774 start_codon:yes stop_codon:yes gene_type:complete
MKKLKSIISIFSLSLLASGCGNWNIKTGSTGFDSADGNYFDNQNRDIISQEYNAYGVLQDCTIGKSSNQRKLPSCNDIRNKKRKFLNKQSRNQKELIKKEEIQKQIDIKSKNKKISKILDKQISGSNLLKFNNGTGIFVNSTIKFNASSSDLIINAQVERDRNTTLDSFKQLFIDDGKYIQISFLDSNGFELLEPINLPLNIEEGQKENIIYRKKSGATAENIVGVRMLARKPLRNILEYSKVKKLQISLGKGISSN